MQSQPTARPRGWSFLLFSTCLIATFSSSPHARGEEGPDADADISLAESKADQAFRAYQGKRFAEAVALYIEAYNAAPNADILYNVARIYDTKLLDRPLAINFYRRYITDPGAVVDRIQIANERLLVLREAELAASRPAPAPVAVPASEARQTANDLESEPGWSANEVLGIAVASTGVIALGVGTVFGIAAMRETKTVNDLCENNVCSAQRGIDTAQDARDHAAVSTIGFASGGVLLALGAGLYYLLGEDPSAPPAKESSPPLGAHLTETPGGFALEVDGSW